MKFRLEKSSGSNRTVSKYDVLDATGSIVGRISVPPEDPDDLLSHWQERPRYAQAAAAATSSKRAIDATLEAGRSAPVVAAPARSKDENPMIGAMLRVASRNRLSKAAVLRG
jgi:hypothetical protein